MLTLYVGIIFTIFVIIIVLIEKYSGGDGFGYLLSILIGFLAIVDYCCFIADKIDTNIEINNFKQQAIYLETYVPEDNIENAALTSKKIELNTWLFEAQYRKSTYKGLSIYPKEILELKPIN